MLDADDTYPLGLRMLYGIPFRFADEDARAAMLRIGGPAASVATVPVARRVEWLLVAHALESPELFEGAPLGAVCGEYRFVYEDGTNAAIAVRQRFEIGPTPRLWSDRPIPLDWGRRRFWLSPIRNTA